MNKPNLRLLVTVVAACVASAQFGYHMAELNGPSEVLSCQKTAVPGHLPSYQDTWYGAHGYAQCIPMDSQGVGLVTSVYSIGGLAGSMYGGALSDAIGRQRTSWFNALFYMIGSLAMTFANSQWGLIVGRLFAGCAAGCTIVVTPLLINEISPAGSRGILGSMTQVSINIGILATQTLAVGWSNSFQWRNILLFGFIISCVNFVLIFFLSESPKWAHQQGDIVKAKKLLFALRQNSEQVDAEIRSYANSVSVEKISILEFIRNLKYRTVLLVITVLTSGPQFCGINSITFYGVKTISAILPNYAVLINCLISLLNVIITCIAAPLIDKFGRKPCLQISSTIMGVASFLMAIGILNNFSNITILATFIYVGSFAIGLGPIPFLMISEISSDESKASAQSVGTTVSWISTFLIGYLFPIFSSSIGGYVYIIFAVVCFCFTLFTGNRIPESKGAGSYEQIWNVVGSSDSATTSLLNNSQV